MDRQHASEPPARSPRALLRIVGPGIIVAATGVGAGDLVAAAKAGATYGLPLLWTAALGALLKFALAEGIARWQLATGQTVLEGWVSRFGPVVQIYFLVYLVLWTVIVSAALMSACGLAAHAFWPQVSVQAWAVVHAILALVFVWLRGYGTFEQAMKIAIGIMFIAILGSAALQTPPLAGAVRGLLVPTIPAGATVLVLGVVGGIGGTLTLLAYNYWMQEKGWTGPSWIFACRFDLGIAYLLTGFFGIAVLLLGATVLLPRGVTISGTQGVLEMATILGARFGRAGELVFLAGFWGAVASSMLGVWQGVPYLFANYVGLLRGVDPKEKSRIESRHGMWYRAFLLFMTFPPMLLLLLEKPVWLVVAYSVVGSLFMPFLAATLLVLNNWKTKMGVLRNGFVANAGLVLSLLLFAYLAANRVHAEWARSAG